MTGVFVFTVIFAFTRENQAALVSFLLLAGVYLVMLVLAFMQTVSKWNYIELAPDGMRIKSAGYKQKFISWSKIDEFFIPEKAMGEVIGISYKRSPRLKWWQIAAKARRSMVGTEDVIKTSYATGEENILDILIKWHEHYVHKKKNKSSRG